MEGWLGGRRGGEERIDLGGRRVRGLGLTTIIRYFTTFIESLTSFLSFFLSLVFSLPH